MAKTYKFEALTTSAGRLSFRPGDDLELAEDEAKELLAAQAIRPLDPRMPDSFYPKGKAPAKTTPAKGRSSQSSGGEGQSGQQSGQQSGE